MKLLLVDDERMILNGLKRALFGTGWKIFTAEGGEEALQFLEDHEVDLIISDMLMPKMNGAELLEEVSKRHPGIIRASLSGYSDPDVTIKGGFFAHQAFMKPCDPSVIKAEVQRIEEILELFPDRVIQNAIGTITSLPVAPKLFFDVKRTLMDPNASMHDVAKLISEEPAMCAKIIQISNNAIFRGRKEIKSISEAITRLGGQVVTNIIAMLEVYSVSMNEPSKPLEKIQSHSLKVAKLASTLVEPDLKDTTFLVGILHRIGEYVRMKIAPDLMSAFLNPRTKGNDKSHLEHYLFKTKSEQLGGYLLHFWGFPLPIIEGVLNHDDPEKLMESDFSPACAVYIANSILSGKAVNEEFAAHFDLESTLAVLEQNHQV